MRTYASHRMTHHSVSPMRILPYQSVIHIQRCAPISRAGRSDAAEPMAWCNTQGNGKFDSNQKDLRRLKKLKNQFDSIQGDSRGVTLGETLASLTSHVGHRQDHGRLVVGVHQVIIDMVSDATLR